MTPVISLWKFTCPSVSFSASSMRTLVFQPEPQPWLFFSLGIRVCVSLRSPRVRCAKPDFHEDL